MRSACGASDSVFSAPQAVIPRRQSREDGRALRSTLRLDQEPAEHSDLERVVHSLDRKERRMPRLTPVDPMAATGETKELLDGIQARFGMIPGTHRGMAVNPACSRRGSPEV